MTTLNTRYGFRPMQIEDLDTILQIEPVIYTHPWTRGNFADSLKSGHSAWVMTSADVIIGYSLMMLVLDEAHLLNISIASAYQKQGLGHVLLAYMVEQAQALAMKTMLLEVRSSNVAAIALYAKMGFVKDSIRKGYYPGEVAREDAVLMSLVLPD